MPMTRAVQNQNHNQDQKQKGKEIKNKRGNEDEPQLWPEEEQALEDIKTGKIPMKKQTGKQFLDDLKTMVNG
jgi:hypothetical protein